MTERISPEVRPFAIGFMSPIAEEEILDATGKYNEATQTWELEKNKADSSSLVMSGANPERPPTTCSQMTKVGDKHWSTDTYVDD